jgi:hypothetical protein
MPRSLSSRMLLSMATVSQGIAAQSGDFIQCDRRNTEPPGDRKISPRERSVKRFLALVPHHVDGPARRSRLAPFLADRQNAASRARGGRPALR